MILQLRNSSQPGRCSSSILKVFIFNFDTRTLIIRFQIEISSAHRIYIWDRRAVVDEDSDSFCLVIVDFSRKKIFYLDPKCENLEDQPHERAHFVCDLLNRFLDHNMEEIAHGANANFTVAMSVDGMHFPRQQNDFDSGMYVFFFTYFCVFESPIFFDNDDVIRMRKQLAYWILKEYLPM